MKTRFLTISLLLLGFLFMVVAPVWAQAPVSANKRLSTPQLIESALANGEIDQETAYLYLSYALGNYDSLPSEYHSNVPWDGTFILAKLQKAVRTMKVSLKRAKVIEILSGSCSSSSGSLSTIVNTTHFHIQYSTIGGGLNIAHYQTSLETAWTKEIDQFGWAAPPVLSSNPPPGNRYHVRIANLGGGLYGFVSGFGTHAGFVGNNPNTAWNDSDAYASCMVLNRDYSGFPGSPQQALDATTAHEFNHSIQYGYGALNGSNAPDDAFVEGGATWMEDEAFDTANDNYNYLWPEFDMCMGEYSEYPYPYWITFRGLTEPYGTGGAGGGEQIMQDFWEEISQNSSELLNALDNALSNQGTSLANAYHAYAVAVKFNKPCSGGYSSPYCFEEGSSYVAAAGTTPLNGFIFNSLSGSSSGSIEDNYALNWVGLVNSGSPYDVTLQNTSAGGQLRGSVVCNTGSTLNVTPLPSVVSSGGSTTLNNFDPSGCTSVVTVITNQAQTGSNPTSCTVRNYTLTLSGGDFVPLTTYLPVVNAN